MSLTSFYLAFIFIVRISTSSYLTQSKALKHQCILTNQLAAMQSKFIAGITLDPCDYGHFVYE